MENRILQKEIENLKTRNNILELDYKKLENAYKRLLIQKDELDKKTNNPKRGDSFEKENVLNSFKSSMTRMQLISISIFKSLRFERFDSALNECLKYV